MIWSLFGAIVGWIQGALGQFRSTNGYLEHTSNGSAWVASGPPLVKASENVKYTWSTERFTSASATENIKVAQLTPNFNGIIRVRADVKYVGTAGQVFVVNPMATAPTNASSIAGSGSYSDTIATSITTLPLGTVLPFTGTGYAKALLFPIPSTTYATVVSDISVTSGIPIIISLYDSSTSASQSYIKNITFSYDFVNGTEQMV